MGHESIMGSFDNSKLHELLIYIIIVITIFQLQWNPLNMKLSRD